MFVYLGSIGLGNGPQVLGNGPHVLGNGLHMLGYGPRVLGKSTFGLMSHSGLLYSMWHSGLCRIWNFIAFGIMLQSGLCRSVLCHLALCRIWGYVILHNVAFSIMLHSHLCLSGLLNVE